MKRLILINWKWLPIIPVVEEEEPDDLNAYINTIEPDSGEGLLLQLNLQREEAEFDDEYEELFEPRNRLLQSLLERYIEEYQVVVFLHKNPPHFYGNYDLGWFKANMPQVKTVLFGGGEDFLYDLHNKTCGLLDQVGNFSAQALTEDGKLRQSYFDGIWNHYNDNKTISNETYALIRELLEDTLPVFGEVKPTKHLVEKSQELLKKQELTLPEELVNALKGLADGNLPDLHDLRAIL